MRQFGWKSALLTAAAVLGFTANAAVGAETPATAALDERISSLNARLLEAAGMSAKDGARHALAADIAGIASERASAMAALIESNPRRALALALPAATEAAALEQRISSLNQRLTEGFTGSETKSAARSAGGVPLNAAELIAERAGLLGRLVELDPARALALALPDEALKRLSAAVPASAAELEEHGGWSGAVAELIADDMFQNRSRRLVWLRTADANLELYFVHEPGRLKSGDLVTAVGVRVGTKVATAAARVLAAATVSPPACVPSGEQKVAALLVSFPGMPQPSITADEVRQALFGTSGPSLDGYWRETSYGKAWATGDVLGWFQLSRAYGCADTARLVDDALLAAAQTVDLTPYTRIYVYYPEPEGGCGWSAMGTIGCVASVQASFVWMPIAGWWTPDRMVELAIHEGGHNLGLQHSDSRAYERRPLGAPDDPGVRQEYGDPFSAMGNSIYFGHYTAYQKLQIGWLSPDQVTTFEGSGTFRVAPLEDPAGGLKALRVRRAANPDAWLWIEYRQPSGIYESTLPAQVFEGALVHYEDAQNSTGQWAGHTDVLDFTPGSAPNGDFTDAALAAGQYWADPWTPRSLEITAAASDGLSITVANDACVSLSPLSREHGAGAESGSVTVTAPADCQWSVLVSAPWIALTSAASGAGDAIVTYRVDANDGLTPRCGEISVGRKPVELTQAPVNQPPVVSGSYLPPDGPVGDFFVFFDDPNGNADLKILRLNINSSSALVGGCALEYDVIAGTVRLADDSGTGWLGPVPNLEAVSLGNGQCHVLYASSWPGGVWASLIFSAKFAGTKKLYASAQDQGGLDSGWQELRSWNVTLNRPPVAVSVFPNTGVGRSQAFTFVYSDPDGPSDIMQVIAVFSGQASRCLVDLQTESGLVTLDSIRGRLGSAGSIENNYCGMNLASSYIVNTGHELRVILAMTFKPAFDGAADLITQVADRSIAWSELATLGRWTVGALPGPVPAITIDGVVNAASFARGPVAPGELVTIFGTDLGPPQIAYASYDSSGYLENIAGSTKVFFDGVQAPMIHALYGQVSAVVPYRVTGSAKIRVEVEGRQSNEITMPVAAAAPGIFRYSPATQGVIVNAEDNTLNSESTPARRGSFVTFFATGEGQTTPAGTDGKLPSPRQWPKPLDEVVVTFGGVPGQVDFVGLVYAGVLQINVVVPEDALAGPDVPLVLSVGGIASPDGTTIALK